MPRSQIILGFLCQEEFRSYRFLISANEKQTDKDRGGFCFSFPRRNDGEDCCSWSTLEQDFQVSSLQFLLAGAVKRVTVGSSLNLFSRSARFRIYEVASRIEGNRRKWGGYWEEGSTGKNNDERDKVLDPSESFVEKFRSDYICVTTFRPPFSLG